VNKHEFLKKLSESDISFSHHGANHDIYLHTPSGKKIAIPRHSEYSNVFLKMVLKEIPWKKPPNA
jgi:hypothetical protein